MFTTQLAESTEVKQSALDPTNLLKDEIDQVANIYNIIIEFFTNYSFIHIWQFFFSTQQMLQCLKYSNGKNNITVFLAGENSECLDRGK